MQSRYTVRRLSVATLFLEDFRSAFRIQRQGVSRFIFSNSQEIRFLLLDTENALSQGGKVTLNEPDCTAQESVLSPYPTTHRSILLRAIDLFIKIYSGMRRVLAAQPARRALPGHRSHAKR